MIILGILIIILLLCVFKHIFYSNKEKFEAKDNLLLNNDFKFSNIIREMSRNLYKNLDNSDMVELKCELKHRCNEYRNYISKSDHKHPWTLHYKYIDTTTIKHKKGVTTFKIRNNKCYIYSYNNNIKKPFAINNYYQICINAKYENDENDENNKIKIKPYLSNSYTDENNEIIYENKNLDFSSFTNKEITWLYYLTNPNFNSLNWYIENGINYKISLSNPCIYKIDNIEEFLDKNKENVVTSLVNCSINKFLIKSDESIINEIKKYINIIYVDKNKNPDNFAIYSQLVNEKVKNINSKSDLKQLLRILLNDIKCNNIIKPVVAYHIYLYNKNKTNSTDKINEDEKYLENNFINYIEWGDNFLDEDETKTIELIILELIDKFKTPVKFSVTDHQNNNNIFNSISDGKHIKHEKDIENIIPVIFEYLTIENLKLDEEDDITKTKIFKNWDDLMISIQDNNDTNDTIKSQFLYSTENLLSYGIEDFLNSLVYIILKIIYKIMDKDLNLKLNHFDLINQKIINLLKNKKLNIPHLDDIINKFSNIYEL